MDLGTIFCYMRSIWEKTRIFFLKFAFSNIFVIYNQKKKKFNALQRIKFIAEDSIASIGLPRYACGHLSWWLLSATFCLRRRWRNAKRDGVEWQTPGSSWKVPPGTWFPPPNNAWSIRYGRSQSVWTYAASGARVWPMPSIGWRSCSITISWTTLIWVGGWGENSRINHHISSSHSMSPRWRRKENRGCMWPQWGLETPRTAPYGIPWARW